MSLFDSLRRSVDHYPGARASIAPRLGKTDEVARKEFSGAPTHKLGAVDALTAARLCVEAGTPHCYDYPAYVAQECGGEFLPRSSCVDNGQSPVQRVTSMVREASDVTSTVIEAMGDGVISDNELKNIEREVAEAHEALNKLMQAARAVNAAGKPPEVIGLPVREMIRSAA